MRILQSFSLFLIQPDAQLTGMPMGSHKKRGSAFCGKPVCVCVEQKGQDRLRERNMSLYKVRNYLLRF